MRVRQFQPIAGSQTDSGLPEIHCAFAREADAARFAQALNATGVGRYPGWASQRQFGLDTEAIKTIVKVLEWIEP